MKHLLAIITVMLFCFTACSGKKEPVHQYDLAVFDSKMATTFYSVRENRSNENHIEIQNFEKYNLTDFINNVSDKNILSLTIYSETLSQNDIDSLINFVKEKNIPVIFAGQAVDNKVLSAYDKAFCITTDYVYAGELFAQKILNMWKDKEILDRDSNLIFAYSVFKTADIPIYMENFYSSLISNIEIYGIPLQDNGEYYPLEYVGIPQEDESETTEETETIQTESIENIKNYSEGFFILSDNYLNDISATYSPVNNGKEIFSIYRGVQNKYQDSAFISACFVDYTNYPIAVGEILANYNNREYPLIKISYPVNNRTVYIPPVV